VTQAAPPSPGPRTRPELIADTAIALLAEGGMRGLTHRAVDEAAGLPSGSTSNHARTRLALLETAFARLVELEAEAMADVLGTRRAPSDRTEFGDLLATTLHFTLTERRVQALARFELALEATRRPELREIYDSSGAAFRDPAKLLLVALGAPEPERQGRALVAWCEGVLFDSLAGAGARRVPGLEELRAGVTDVLDGIFGPSV
jgi:AcrR family transcriptional regulator